MVVAGGMTLRVQLRKVVATGRIDEGGWNAVVLQEQSIRPIQASPLLDKVIRQFIAEVTSLGKTLTAGAQCPLGRQYLASVNTLISTNALVVRSADLDRLTHCDPCLAQVIRRNLASG